jgi:hypothetical protein
MTAAEFKKKWSRYQGKETSAYQSHFDDLCRLLGQPTPNEADPSGSEFFCFQKRVVKDAELFEMDESPDASEPTERGFADVWKTRCRRRRCLRVPRRSDGRTDFGKITGLEP